jgi:hypothetical protein
MVPDSHLDALSVGTGPGNVSGAIVLDQLALAREMLGEEVVARALRLLTPAARAELGGLLPVSWCSLTTAFDLHHAFAEVTGKDVAAWRRTIISAGIERTLSTVWRLFMRFTSVEAIVKRAAFIYGKSYDRGAVRAALVANDTVEVVLTDWPDVPRVELEAIACGLDVVLAIAKKNHSHITFERNPGGARFEVHLRHSSRG